MPPRGKRGLFPSGLGGRCVATAPSCAHQTGSVDSGPGRCSSEVRREAVALPVRVRGLLGETIVTRDGSWKDPACAGAPAVHRPVLSMSHARRELKEPPGLVRHQPGSPWRP